MARVRGFGRREEVALGAIAAELDEPATLDLGLDALGGHHHAERVRHVDGRRHDRVVGRALAEPGDECLVDLELVERVAAEVGE